MLVCSNCGEENPPRFRLCGFCGTPLADALPPQEVRKTVTIVFSDLQGSTSLGERLDPESLREVMSQYFREMRAALERHGGRVEKYIGDAIMAVFGLPKAHEDDALRAVRAAAAMQEALARVNEQLERRWGVRLVNRTGVNTGEVIAADAADAQRLVTGDTVNVAARLEQAAPGLEVLLGESTYRIVKELVDVEQVDPLELKGKSERVNAYRLLAARDGQTGRRRDAPLVGRTADLAVLTEAFDLVVSGRASWTVTILGDAGLGKTRLAEELVRHVDDRALVLRGRCLPYGDGITFWPLIEGVQQAAGIDGSDQTDAARAKLLALAGDAAVADRVAAAVGLSAETFPLPELYWGVRKLFERLARQRPLVVLFDDLHWAEDAFLELVGHLTDTLGDAPVLLVCASRPELLDERRLWADKPNAAHVALEPLTTAESAAVMHNLLGRVRLAEEVVARVVEAAEGNPLFVEQLLSMLVDDGLVRLEGDCWVPTAALSQVAIPPTIQALLAARLDRLEREERSVVEPASVIGYAFPVAAVRQLAPQPVQKDVGTHLATLARKRFVRPGGADRTNGGAAATGGWFRFDHILIRDATYETLLKRARATLHERFVEWADRVNGDRVQEYEEILGYHLEQAYRYLGELGPLDEHGLGVGADAARRLSSAGRRAMRRGDAAAAANLLERAAALLPELDPGRIELLPDLGETLVQLGRFAEADAVLRDASDAAVAASEVRLQARASLVRLLVRLRTGDADEWADAAVAEVDDAIEVFEEAGDHAGVAKALRVIGHVHGNACRYGEAAAAAERALRRAKRAGDAREYASNATTYALAAMLGPTPVPDAIRVCEQTIGDLAENRSAQGVVYCLVGPLHAMRGDFDRARELWARGRTAHEELGVQWLVARVMLEAARVEMLADDPAAAESRLRAGLELCELIGERYARSTMTALLGRAVAAQGRLDEADDLSATAEELAGRDDVVTQSLWRCVRASVWARRGRIDDAMVLVQEALQLVLPTDSAVTKVDVLLDLGDVSKYADDRAAAWAFQEAATLAQLKGNVVTAAAARRRLLAVGDPAQTRG